MYKQDLIVRKYIDGLEPKSPLNFKTIVYAGRQLPGPILAGSPAFPLLRKCLRRIHSFCKLFLIILI